MLPTAASRLAFRIVIGCGLLMGGRGLHGESVPDSAMPPESIAAQFRAADQDRDGQLSEKEYLAGRAAPEQSRDFRLFDADHSKFLSLQEFWSIPRGPDASRGPLIDPWQGIVDRFQDSFDKSIDWKRFESGMDADHFANSYWRRFEAWFNRGDLATADADADGQVTREEVRQFVEQELGLRGPGGELLHLPEGIVVDLGRFHLQDRDHDLQLSRQEWNQSASSSLKNAASDFDAIDQSRDGQISIAEWCTARARWQRDPVVEFLAWDTSRDGKLDRRELLAGLPESARPMATAVFKAFDLDQDDAFSLTEFRLSILANPVLPWLTEIVDLNGDDALAFAEFKFHTPRASLLRYLYFQRLDINRSGKIERDEFPFRTKVPDEFFVLNADGTGWKSLYKFEGHPACGSPCVSPDGKLIAFDANDPQRRSTFLYLMPRDGGEPQEIAAGSMPSWLSPTRLACSRSQPRYGVWILDLEGTQHQHLGSGWSAQASPDGQRVSFVEGNALFVYDRSQGRIEELLNRTQHSYQQIFWNSAWSPDGRRICFKGHKAAGEFDVVIADTSVKPVSLKVIVSGTAAINADFAWHPEGRRIVFAMRPADQNSMQLYEFNPDADAPPVLVRGQDATRNNTDACWTPDGSQLIIVSGDY